MRREVLSPALAGTLFADTSAFGVGVELDWSPGRSGSVCVLAAAQIGHVVVHATSAASPAVAPPAGVVVVVVVTLGIRAQSDRGRPLEQLPMVLLCGGAAN